METLAALDGILREAFASALLNVVVGLGLLLLVTPLLGGGSGRGRFNAPTRYAVWCVMLITLPALLLLGLARPADAARQELAPITSSAQHGPPTIDSVRPRDVPTTTPSVPPSHEATSDATPPVARIPAWQIPDPGPKPFRWLFVIWSTMATILLVRLALAWVRLERTKMRASPLPGRFHELRDEIHRLAKTRPVRIGATDEFDTPIACGPFRPTILLPRRLLRELGPAEIRHVLLHELAHLQRRDDWTHLLERVVRSLLFFHPAVLWLSRRMHVDRELACDDWVVARTRRPRDYARCLTRIVELDLMRRRHLVAAGVGSSRRLIHDRVARLVRGRGVLPEGVSAGRLSWATVLVVVSALGCAWLAPFVSFAETPPPPPSPPDAIAPKDPPAVSSTSTPEDSKPAMSARSWIRYFRSVERIASSGDRSMVLVGVADRLPRDPDVHIAYIDAAATLPSSHDRARALTALIRAGDVGSEARVHLLDTATKIPSDGDKSRVLSAVVETGPLDDAGPAAYLRAAESLHSSDDYRRAMRALLDTSGV